MEKILFFGDSITDCHRKRDDIDSLGDGYPSLVKAALGFENPEKYTFINTGISGDNIVNLYARVKRDLINFAPDYVSILIGINGVGHEVSFNCGISAEKYEQFYDMLLSEIKSYLPNVKIMIMEPFVLEASSTENTEEKPKRWDYYKSEVPKRAKIAEKIAKKYNLPFIELQNKFNEVSKGTENSYWLRDGVHPTPMGHELIKREWIKAFRNI